MSGLAMPRFPIDRIRIAHPHAGLWESLEDEPSFVLRAMFGAKAAYLDGKLALCFSAKEDPWRGILVCTDRSHHPSLIAEFPALAPHPILGKWLYLPESSDNFEAAAERLVRLVRRRDPRIGIIPGTRKRKPARPA